MSRHQHTPDDISPDVPASRVSNVQTIRGLAAANVHIALGMIDAYLPTLNVDGTITDKLSLNVNHFSTVITPGVPNATDIALSISSAGSPDGYVLTSDGLSGAAWVAPRIPVEYVADSMWKDAGGAIAGTVVDTRTLGGTEVDLTEQAAAPGFTLRFVFSSVVAPSQAVAHVYYTGNHVVTMQGYNYALATWVTLATLTTGASTFGAYVVPLTADYVSAGISQLQFDHSAVGNPTHHLHVDYIAIGSNQVIPSQIDHGALGGLTNPDHPASAIVNTPAGTIAATTVQAAIDELDTEKVPTTRTITAGVALAGGGDLSANRTLDVDITELAADAAPEAAADYVMTYDNSAVAHKKVLLSNLPAGTAVTLTVTLAKQFAATSPPAGDSSWPFMDADHAFTLKKVRTYMIGSGSADVNVTVAGADALGADLACVGGSWASSAVITVAVAAGDDVAIEIRNVAGVVSYVAVQLDYQP